VSLAGQRTQLTALSRELFLHWQRTREQWRDARGAEFQQKYLDELFSSVSSAAEALDQLDKLLTKIRNDCA
jgi:hypothetical protein